MENDPTVYAVGSDPVIHRLFVRLAAATTSSVDHVARTFMLMGVHLWAQDHGFSDVALHCGTTLIAEAPDPEEVSVTIVTRY